MTVTVAIATYERPDTILRAARSVLDQLPAGGELLVVDQSSAYHADTQHEIDGLASSAAVKWVRGGPPSLPAARNYALEIAAGGIVIFVDDDVELLPGFIDAHLRAFDDAFVVGTCGRVLRPDTDPTAAPPPALNRVPRMRIGGWITGSFEATVGGDTNTLYGCNMAVRRGDARRVGGFDTGLVGNAFREDAEFASRLGRVGRLSFVTDAALIHFASPVGGCRVAGAPEVDPSLYRNETRLFRSAHPMWKLPLWAVSVARRNVVCGPAMRERRVLASAGAFARGITRELTHPNHTQVTFTLRGE